MKKLIIWKLMLLEDWGEERDDREWDGWITSLDHGGVWCDSRSWRWHVTVEWRAAVWSVETDTTITELTDWLILSAHLWPTKQELWRRRNGSPYLVTESSALILLLTKLAFRGQCLFWILSLLTFFIEFLLQVFLENHFTLNIRRTLPKIDGFWIGIFSCHSFVQSGLFPPSASLDADVFSLIQTIWMLFKSWLECIKHCAFSSLSAPETFNPTSLKTNENGD